MSVGGIGRLESQAYCHRSERLGPFVRHRGQLLLGKFLLPSVEGGDCVYGGALLCAGAIGPILSAVLSDVTGDRRWVAVVITVAASAAAVAARGLGRDRADLRSVDHAEHAIE